MNPQAMNKNTGDGELDDLHKWLEQSFAGFMATDPITHTRASTQMAADYAMKRIEAVIRSELAQEANKAQQQLLKELMEYEITLFNSNDTLIHAVPLQVIQNKLEGLS